MGHFVRHAILCLLASSFEYIAKAQRVEPCFTAPPSCHHGLKGYELTQFFFNEIGWVDTCKRLGDEFFEFEYIDEWQTVRNLTDFDMQKDWMALAAIPADSKFCEDSHRFIAFCDFCGHFWFEECDFWLNPLSCDDYRGFEPLLEPDSFEMRQSTCAWLEGILGLGDDIFNETLRNGALNTVGGITGMCDAYRQAYPHCYWCDESITDTSYCYFDNMCDQEDVVGNLEVDVEKVCGAIESVIHADIDKNIRTNQIDRFMTWDLCQRARQVAPKHCPEVCASCFNETHPPMCMENPDDLPPETTDVAFGVAQVWYFLSPVGTGVPADESRRLDLMHVVRASHPWCPKLREAYPHGWWCDPQIADFSNPYFCTFGYCADVSENPGRVGWKPYNGTDQKEFQEYCGRAQDLYDQDLRVGSTIDLCRGQQLYAESCLCVDQSEREIAQDYLDTDTKAKKRALVWTSRASAILSFLGACYIVRDVYQNTRQDMKVYHQLLVGMAVSDLVTAVAWSFATLPINDDEGYEIYGAKGGDGSCRAQGFFIQLGFTSIFYNVSLATYYYLVLAQGWKEKRLRNLRPYLHAPPIVVGLALALVALPHYEGFDYACHLLPYPSGELWTVYVFAVLPIGCSVLFISLAMVAMYLVVRAQSQNPNKWAFGFGKSATMQKLVFWQALFYAFSFYITWPIILCVYVTGWDYEKKVFGFSILVALVGPLQGFNNFLVYTRARVIKWLTEYVRSMFVSAGFSTRSSFSGRRNFSVPSGSTPRNQSASTPQNNSASTPQIPSREALSSVDSYVPVRYINFEPSIAIAEDEDDDDPDGSMEAPKDGVPAKDMGMLDADKGKDIEGNEILDADKGEDVGDDEMLDADKRQDVVGDEVSTPNQEPCDNDDSAH